MFFGNVSDILLRHLNERGVTATAIADAARCDTSTVSRWFNGDRDLSDTHGLRLIDQLACSPLAEALRLRLNNALRHHELIHRRAQPCDRHPTLEQALLGFHDVGGKVHQAIRESRQDGRTDDGERDAINAAIASMRAELDTLERANNEQAQRDTRRGLNGVTHRMATVGRH